MSGNLTPEVKESHFRNNFVQQIGTLVFNEINLFSLRNFGNQNRVRLEFFPS